MKPIYSIGLAFIAAAASVMSKENYDMVNELGKIEARAEHMEHMNHVDQSKTKSEEIETTQSSSEEVVATPHVEHHHHGMPILQTELLPEERKFWENYNTTTYFTIESEHKTALYWHICLTLMSFVFLYPICLVLNNVGSNWYYPLLFVHSASVLVGLISLSVFVKSIPNLYPNNAYNKMSVILGISTIAHVIFAVFNFGYKAATSKDAISADYFTVSDEESQESCTSPSATLYDTPRDTSNSTERDGSIDYNLKTSLGSMFPANNHGNRFLKKVTGIPVVNTMVNFFGKFSVYIFNLLNWCHFFYFLIYLPTAVATFGCFGQGGYVFNLLAHFIKGGVFFSLGLLYLARYCGAFTNKGWAWNHKFIKNYELKLSRWNRIQSKGLCTMEMIESSLILFYGCTNIFMEHLSNPGGEWSAKDLQHASIAFIYIGCGLCGILTEFKLANWRFEKSISNFENFNGQSVSSKIVKAAPGFSPNPFPILTIYWTGVLMSQHAQASILSTEIHKQWGNLFVLGTVFRFITYLLLLVLPTNKDLTKPLRPISELLVCFSLLCGGLIFIESCDPIVYAFEYRGFTSMFTLNISLGLVTLLMSWEMSVFAFKDWLLNRA
mmetsp:Transcript_4417/g.4408  ORF Transcript_4417/g.4408 Transcript_4417/m.4408 type:complete len:609 (+) Transcript_4417:71-1897(+)